MAASRGSTWTALQVRQPCSKSQLDPSKESTTLSVCQREPKSQLSLASYRYAPMAPTSRSFIIMCIHIWSTKRSNTSHCAHVTLSSPSLFCWSAPPSSLPVTFVLSSPLSYFSLPPTLSLTNQQTSISNKSRSSLFHSWLPRHFTPAFLSVQISSRFS